jgi:hypothetical protein
MIEKAYHSEITLLGAFVVKADKIDATADSGRWSGKEVPEHREMHYLHHIRATIGRGGASYGIPNRQSTMDAA